MATFVNDTFTEASDTALTSHTGETGATWTGQPGSGPSPHTIAAAEDAVRGNGAGQFYASGSPVSADYSVTGVFTFTNEVHPAIWGVAGRMSTSAQTGYHAIRFSNEIRLYKYVAGTLTLIGSGVTLAAPFTPGETFTMTLDLSGTTIAIRVQRASDNNWLASANTWQSGQVNCISQTDSAITAAGKAGTWLSGEAVTNKGYLTSFSAADPVTASFTATPSTIPDEDAAITLTLAGTSTTWAAGGSEFSVSGLAGVSKVSENVTSATAATLVVETVGATTGTLTITDGDALTTTVTVATASLARTPTSINTSTTTSIALTGTNTLWTQETAAGLFSVSGVSGCSISGTPTVTTNTAASIDVVSGATTGTLTITDNSNGATTTVTVAPGPTTIAVTDTNVVFSPYNWYSDGAGAMASNNVKGSSTYAVSNNPGAYVKTKIVVGTIGNVYVNVDTSHHTGYASAANWPTLAYSIDGGAMGTALLSSGQTQVDLGSLSAATHTIVVWFKSIGEFGIDRWNGTPPPNAVKISGFQAPAGSTSAAPTVRARNMIIYGDSITEGLHNLASTSDNAAQNAGYTWAQFVAEALDAEVGIIGFGGAATNSGGIGNAPAATTSYSLYSSGRSRLVSGALSPAPDYIISNYGENGVDSASHTTFLAALRTAAPSAIIFNVDPFNGDDSLSGVTLPSAPAYRIDLPGNKSGGIMDTITGYQTPVHPDVPGSARIAARLTEALLDYIATSTSFGTFGAGRL